MSFRKQLSDRIKFLRKERNLPAEKVAWGGGLSKSCISDIEACRNDAKVVTIKQICKGLKISLAEFFSTFTEIETDED